MGLTPLVTGSGDPVTVAAHGLGASIAETRPLLSGVAGVLGIFGAIVAVAAIVYLVDVRPAVREMRPGGGPWG